MNPVAILALLFSVSVVLAQKPCDSYVMNIRFKLTN